MAKIYLISPPQIQLKDFSKQLESALSTGLVATFQLRLKSDSDQEIIKIGAELKKICHNFDCPFLLNDNSQLAIDLEADGVHLGVDDDFIFQARKSSKANFIIGASCYDSRHLVMEAGERGADYVSFGSFFDSKTKNSRGRPTTEIIAWCNEFINLPIVAIGGITDQNCQPLVKSGADFLAVISYVWQHSSGSAAAVKNLQEAIKSES
jgi:thiamine-phosphate pyrophosphorylase